jgi:FkbM family methyltransferase
MLSKYVLKFALMARRVYLWQKRRRYERLGKDHIFNVSVSGSSFLMSFLDYSVDQAIVERIEGRRERETAAVIQTIVPPGANVLEIGACYGYFTNIMASCVGPTGRVVSLDGDPDVFKVLLRNMELNDLSNVDAFNVFIASTSDVEAIESTTDGSATELEYPGAEVGQTETVVLSKFLEKIEFQPEFLFMDIEGFEVDVFEDISRNFLKSSKPVIVFEMHPQFYKPGKTVTYVKGLLDTFGYRYQVVAENLVCVPTE